MKYTCEVTIDLPREQVVKLFDNPETMREWMPGLQEFQHLSGEPGKIGAKSRLIFDENGRKLEMTETITQRNLPETFSGTYETGSTYNIIENHFYEEGNKTRWVTHNEFKFSGFMRLMAIFMPESMFRKQSMKNMNQFKHFAEQQTASAQG